MLDICRLVIHLVGIVGIGQLTVKKILAELNRFQERKVYFVLGMFIKILDNPVDVTTPAMHLRNWLHQLL